MTTPSLRPNPRDLQHISMNMCKMGQTRQPNPTDALLETPIETDGGLNQRAHSSKDYEYCLNC
jgi:hypothetical protein